MGTFLLGVGCQKGGTTWLHDYLDGHPEVNMGPMKEYHVLDRILRHPDQGWSVEPWARRAWMHGYRLTHRQDLGKGLRYGFVLRAQRYFDFFPGLFSRSPGVKLVGDITPSYAYLTEGAYERVKREFNARDMAVKVIFIMRDPVERVISSARMKRGHRLDRLLGGARQTEVEEILRSYTRKDCQQRTRYEVTIAHLDQTFSPQDVLYLFYEELFRDETIHVITDFLGISYMPANFTKQVNVSLKTEAIGDDVRRKVFAAYRGTYDFVARRFGEDRVASLWQNYSKLKSVEG